MKKISTAFIIATLVGCFGAEPQKTGLEGKPLPSVNLLLPDSSTWSNINNTPNGKPVALFYFSPNCPYCKAQTREIIEDYDKLKGIQFYFITGYPIPDIKKYSKEFELDKYPNIVVGRDTASTIGDYFEIPGVPYIAIYNKDKKLNKTYVGKIYSSQIKRVAEE